MIKFPKKTKFKKLQRKQLKKTSKIKSLFSYQKQLPTLFTKNSTILTLKQIEAFRKLLIRKLKLTTKILIPIIPDLALTAKPTAMRMGKGKGNFKEWTCKFKSGTKLFQFKSNISIIGIQKLLKKNKFNKLPCFLKFY